MITNDGTMPAGVGVGATVSHWDRERVGVTFLRVIVRKMWTGRSCQSLPRAARWVTQQTKRRRGPAWPSYVLGVLDGDSSAWRQKSLQSGRDEERVRFRLDA